MPAEHETTTVPPLGTEFSAACTAPESSLPSQRAPNDRMSVCAMADGAEKAARRKMAEAHPR